MLNRAQAVQALQAVHALQALHALRALRACRENPAAAKPSSSTDTSTSSDESAPSAYRKQMSARGAERLGEKGYLEARAGDGLHACRRRYGAMPMRWG